MPPAVARENTSLSDDSYRTITLFLIRHGQASHNVEEQAAQKHAQQICLSQGLAADAPLTKERMEEARQEILENPTFFDAELSIQGSREATDASNDLRTICDNLGITFPTEVMVSPLQRTLQTASLVFPNHKNILVREELRERLTGRPADNRASSTELSKKESFKHLDFHHIRVKSLVNDLTDIFGMQQVMQDLQEIEEADNESMSFSTTYGSCASLSQLVTSSSRNTLSQLVTSSSRNSLSQLANVSSRNSLSQMVSSSSSRNSLCQLASSSSKTSLRGESSQRGSSCNADTLVEDEPQLAARTKKIMPLLVQSSHTHIALVTHKGYLRALEKTQLHQGTATRNFGNGEIRVYRATIHKSRKQVERITRLH